MGGDRYTSIYLPGKLKRQIVAAAESEGFAVGRGRHSCLAKFVEVLLQEHQRLVQKDSTVPSLQQLAPELRSSILRLGTASTDRQKRASKMLHLLLSDWQDSGSVDE